MSEAVMTGVIRGRTVELDRPPDFPEGMAVTVRLTAAHPAGTLPADPQALERLRRSAGSWADGGAELDDYLDWNRRQRKVGRAAPE